MYELNYGQKELAAKEIRLKLEAIGVFIKYLADDEYLNNYLFGDYRGWLFYNKNQKKDYMQVVEVSISDLVTASFKDFELTNQLEKEVEDLLFMNDTSDLECIIELIKQYQSIVCDSVRFDEDKENLFCEMLEDNTQLCKQIALFPNSRQYYKNEYLTDYTYHLLEQIGEHIDQVICNIRCICDCDDDLINAFSNYYLEKDETKLTKKLDLFNRNDFRVLEQLIVLENPSPQGF